MLSRAGAARGGGGGDGTKPRRVGDEEDAGVRPTKSQVH